MYLGLDLGTGSLKALVLDEAGRVIDSSAVPYAIHSPQANWAESDPEDWWQALVSAVNSLRAPRDQIRAIGLSGQMHTLVLSDDGGTALRPAILWADTRSNPQLERYRALEPQLQHCLGNPLVAGMTGPSLLWVKEHEPNLFERAAHAFQPKDWLRMRLTGEAATDPSDASATLLYNVAAHDGWAYEVLAALGLPAHLLPAPQPSSRNAGTLTRRAAQILGLTMGIPVACGAGDTASAILGSGLDQASAVQLTVGTGAQLVAPRHFPTHTHEPRTHHYRSAAGTRWYAMAAMQNAGLALERARTILGYTWAEAYDAAFNAAPHANGAHFLPYLSGERTPHLDARIRGGWLGLGLEHDRADLMRAAFNGVAFAIRAGLEALTASGAEFQELRVAGGGSLDPRWRQLLADTLGCALNAVAVSDASARGAALLAVIADGRLDERGALEGLAPQREVVAEPRAASAALMSESYARFSQLYPRLRGWNSSPSTPPDPAPHPAALQASGR